MQNSHKMLTRLLTILAVSLSVFLASCDGKKKYHPFVNKVWEILLIKYDDHTEFSAPNTKLGKRFLYIHNYEYRCEASNILNEKSELVLNSTCEKINLTEAKIKAELDKIKISGNSAQLSGTAKINNKDMKVLTKYLLSTDKNHPSAEQIIAAAKKQGNFLKK